MNTALKCSHMEVTPDVFQLLFLNQISPLLRKKQRAVHKIIYAMLSQLFKMYTLLEENITSDYPVIFEEVIMNVYFLFNIFMF